MSGIVALMSPLWVFTKVLLEEIWRQFCHFVNVLFCELTSLRVVQIFRQVEFKWKGSCARNPTLATTLHHHGLSYHPRFMDLNIFVVAV